MFPFYFKLTLTLHCFIEKSKPRCSSRGLRGGDVGLTFSSLPGACPLGVEYSRPTSPWVGDSRPWTPRPPRPLVRPSLDCTYTTSLSRPQPDILALAKGRCRLSNNADATLIEPKWLDDPRSPLLVAPTTILPTLSPVVRTRLVSLYPRLASLPHPTHLILLMPGRLTGTPIRRRSRQYDSNRNGPNRGYSRVLRREF